MLSLRVAASMVLAPLLVACGATPPGVPSAPPAATASPAGFAASPVPSLPASTLGPTPAPTIDVGALPGRIAFDLGHDPNGNSSTLAVISPDGTGYRDITTLADGLASDPAWSRAGVATLFYDVSSATATHIFSIELVSGPPKQLTSGAVHDFDPAVSPDGRSLAFDRAPGGASAGPASIFILDLASGQLTRATTPPAGATDGDLYPDWSPDGTHLAYEEDGSIAIVDLRDGSTRTVLTPRQPAHRPKWSPDGQSILFGTTNIDSAPHQVQLVGLDGQDARPLTDPAMYAVHPCWSPDGRFIAYIVRNAADRDLELRVMTAGGGGSTVIWHTPPGTDLYPGHPSWGSPSGG